ncbi:50S ribosome-binding GTPase [Clostridium perfringens]|uniref:YcjF family protein n=1 Tax=Clostridium perfringens TaxID=1502 RepID=UPI0018E400BD|nr:GTPase [Clostridium perfringens]MDB2061261.1 50S ribosome-binding GTPase [Clostridium perfringens]MDB2064418.1 50S ribosome-binding GTPase [Clostridium perfringens]MDB2066905.1 50S ribosome-binding GTPase [Clostridium perfringens]MDJ8943261.1 50S ribosome-binding GTPase [Clostridium perfringens]MDK0530846.1 50S ribosome-binding GTPase [Clostridium perfringens]
MEDFNVFTEAFNRIEKELNNMDKANILIVGKTGAGKSTLINSVFRAEMAETGTGRPVTQHLKKISKEGIPVNLYDTKGLELNETVQAEIKKEILDEIEKCNDLCIRNDSKAELIHACWYCIDGSVRRCEETDIDWINDIAEKVPVIVVVTKGFPKKDAREFRKKIENLNLNCRAIVPVLAEKYEDRDEEEDDEVVIIPSYGLDKLVDVTLEVLPEGVRKAFNNAQKVSLDKKVSAARKWVTGYAATTGAIGASPIPFSDAPLLVTAQLSMLAHVTAIFGLPVEKAVLTAIIGSVTGVSGTTLGGKTLVSNLLKMIPGVGTVAGGAISASVASMMTIALGLAYISVLKFIIEEEIKGNIVNIETIKEKMKEAYKKELILSRR